MTTIDSRRAPRAGGVPRWIVAGRRGRLVSAAELPTARPADVGLSAERLARLDAAMQAEVDAGRKAGIVALIARRGRVAHFKAFGMADREANMPMRDDSLFRLYSMTKPITSVALLMLYEEGKFQLSDPLEKYIPAFKGVQVLAGMDGERMRLEPARRPPTIHDVFRHTAGFSYGFDPQTPIDRAYAQNGVDFGTATSLKQLVAEGLPKVPLLYQPGEQWVYSVAHDVQAYLVEYFSGMPFDEFCRERIFKPLGMSDATFGVPKNYVARYTANYAPRDPANPAAGLVQVETREGVAPPVRPSASPLAARLRPLHGHSVRRLEHLLDGDGLRAVRPDARQRRRAERHALARHEDRRAHDVEQSAAEHPGHQLRRPAVGRDGLRARRLGHAGPSRGRQSGLEGHVRLGRCGVDVGDPRSGRRSRADPDVAVHGRPTSISRRGSRRSRIRPSSTETRDDRRTDSRAARDGARMPARRGAARGGLGADERQDPDRRCGLQRRRGARDRRRPHRRARHERGDGALRGRRHESHRRRGRDRHPGPHRQPLPPHARRRAMAPPGAVRRRRLAPRSAADTCGQGRRHAGRRVDHGAGRLDAATVRRRAGWVHARGARRRGAEESAVRAGGLQRRLREQPRAQSHGAQPGRRRATQRRGARVVPAAVLRCSTRFRRPRPRSSSRTSRITCTRSMRPG